MRYTIGYTQSTKWNNKIVRSGIYGSGEYCFEELIINPEDLSKIDFDKTKTYIYVSDDVEQIQQFARILTRQHRNESWGKKQKSIYIKHFYPVKIDSSKFPLLIKKSERKTPFHFKNGDLNLNADVYLYKVTGAKK